MRDTLLGAYEVIEAIWEWMLEHLGFTLLMLFVVIAIVISAVPKTQDPCDQYQETPYSQVPAKCIGIFGGIR